MNINDLIISLSNITSIFKKYIFHFIIFVSLSVFIFAKSFSGSIMIFSFAILLIISHFSNQNKIKKYALFTLTLISFASIIFNGINLGIDFAGGTRIPVILESAVDQETMQDIVNTIQVRSAAFGLTEVNVQSVGSNQLFVEVSSADQELVDHVENILSHQGVFEGIVDGKIAVRGDYIQPGTVRRSFNQEVLLTSDWAVSFSVNRIGAEVFSQNAYGKAGYPIHLFLDRPSSKDLLIISPELFLPTDREDANFNEAIEIVKKAVSVNNESIFKIINSNEFYSIDLKEINESARAIVYENEDEDIILTLQNLGYNVMRFSKDEMTPSYTQDVFDSFDRSVTNLNEWKAIGLISSPFLSEGVTRGTPNYDFIITGGRREGVDVDRSATEIISLLRGGSLPVKISIGSKTIIPAPLGSEFLRVSIIGAFFALISISAFIVLKYRSVIVIGPMTVVTICEMIILLAIIGSFTIDLGSMAGIIATIGVSIDSKIIIADELLKKSNTDINKKLKRAFSIVLINVMTAIVAMIPLIFSGMVEIIGFAMSSMIGSVLGGFISRPSFGAILQDMIVKEEK